LIERRAPRAAAEHAAGADADARRASSADFDGWFLLNRFPDLWVRRSSGQAARF